MTAPRPVCKGPVVRAASDKGSRTHQPGSVGLRTSPPHSASREGAAQTPLPSHSNTPGTKAMSLGCRLHRTAKLPLQKGLSLASMALRPHLRDTAWRECALGRGDCSCSPGPGANPESVDLLAGGAGSWLTPCPTLLQSRALEGAREGAGLPPGSVHSPCALPRRCFGTSGCV